LERSVSFCADPKAVGEARKQLRGALDGRGVDRQRVQDVLLVTSELVANAVLHGSRQGDRVELEFQLVRNRLSLCVRDAGRGREPHVLALGAERTTGRGLAIVSHLARWSEHEVDGGREVRAEMDL
jgi:anti-sigma regulatory factor (Ser/Thr protein kinase)